MSNSFLPASGKERLPLIDSLRGLALLGIILANIPMSTDSGPVPAAWFAPGQAADTTLKALVQVLVSTKFITLFSILFGAGFYFQLSKAAQHGIAFRQYFIRRMLLLLVIGSAHAYLLWHGDILRYYALCGIGLLLVYQLPQRRILLWAVLFIVPITALVFIANKALGLQTYSYDPGLIKELFLTNSYARFLQVNFTIDSMRNFIQDAPLTLVSCFGKMLLGYWLARTGFFTRPEAFGAMTRRWIWLGATLGIGSSVGYWAVNSGRLELDLPQLWIPFVIAGGLVLHSLLYLGLFARLFMSSGRKVLQLFAPVGKMALTNYLLQTVACLLLFYHWPAGPALFGKTGTAETYLVALGIFAFQVALSHWYLRHFKQGPVEYLWRKMAYRRVVKTAWVETRHIPSHPLSP